jgi:hypothetical protein
MVEQHDLLVKLSDFLALKSIQYHSG